MWLMRLLKFSKDFSLRYFSLVYFPTYIIQLFPHCSFFLIDVYFFVVFQDVCMQWCFDQSLFLSPGLIEFINKSKYTVWNDAIWIIKTFASVTRFSRFPRICLSPPTSPAHFPLLFSPFLVPHMKTSKTLFCSVGWEYVRFYVLLVSYKPI